MTFAQAAEKITPPSPQAVQAAQDRFARLGPDQAGKLGCLEQLLVRLAGFTHQSRLDLSCRTLVVAGRGPAQLDALAQAAARTGLLGHALRRSGCGVLPVALERPAASLPGVLVRPLEDWAGGTSPRKKLTAALDAGADLAQMLASRNTGLVLLTAAKEGPLPPLPKGRLPFYRILEEQGSPQLAFLTGLCMGCAALKLPFCPDGEAARWAAQLAAGFRPQAAQGLVLLEGVSGAPAQLGMEIGLGCPSLLALPLLDGMVELYQSLAPSPVPYRQRPMNVFQG